VAEPAIEQPDVETSSEDYARRFSGPVGAWFLDVQTRTTATLLGDWPVVSVLDVGGGHGQLTGSFVNADYDVTIYCSSDVCLERVRPWVDAGRARFRAGDLLTLPWPDRHFDVVAAFRLLPHVTRWPDLVRELCRVARRAVIVDYPTSRSINAVSGAFFGLKKGVEGNTRPFTVFNDAEIAVAFGVHGFRITARRPEFLFPMALHRGLRLPRLSRALEGFASAVGLTSRFGSPVILRAERV
jgi:SAM-dependent methyltransferase